MALWWCIAFISCHHWVHRSYPPSVLCSTWSSGTCMYRFALGSLVWINSWPQPCLACSIMVLWFLFFYLKAGSFFHTTPAHLVWRVCFVFHCWIQLMELLLQQHIQAGQINPGESLPCEIACVHTTCFYCFFITGRPLGVVPSSQFWKSLSGSLFLTARKSFELCSGFLTEYGDFSIPMRVIML